MSSIHKNDEPLNVWRGIGLVALGALLFSGGIIFTRSIQGLSAPVIAFTRAVAAFCFFSVWMARQPLERCRFTERSTVALLIGLGLSMGATAMLYIFAVQQTTAANAVLLNNSAPLYVAWFSPWFLREARPRYTWLSLGLALVGVLCVTNPANLDLDARSFGGMAAALVSGFSYALTMLFSRRLRDRVPGLVQVWLGVGLAALVALPWALTASWAALATNWHLCVGLGIVSLGIPYMLYFLGLQHVKAQVVSIVGLLEPASGVLIGALLYREVPDALGFAGIVLVLSSIALISR